MDEPPGRAGTVPIVFVEQEIQPIPMAVIVAAESMQLNIFLTLLERSIIMLPLGLRRNVAHYRANGYFLLNSRRIFFPSFKIIAAWQRAKRMDRLAIGGVKLNWRVINRRGKDE